MQPDRTYLDWPFFDQPHRELAGHANTFAKSVEHLADEHDVDTSCRNLVAALGDAGLLAYAVPEPGAALDVRSLCLLRETLARHAGLADFAFAMQGLGTGAITLFGTPAQRATILPPVRAGTALAAFALSEQEAGSDVAALATTAERDGPDYILNGNKTWISNGGIASFYTVFARTGEAPGTRGLSAFIVLADTPGLEIAERIEVIAPHPLATLRFRSCRIPAAAMIGEPGEGFKIAMAVLDVFRPTVAAAALGMARRALQEAARYAATRILFAAPLSNMQTTQASLAEMATSIDASALLVYRAAWAKDNGAPRITREAAMAKLFATEAAQRVVDAAVQIHGGLGVKKGTKVEELYRDVRALRIYEGASEVQRQVIARQMLAGAA